MLRKTMIFWACAMICLISARAGVCQQFDPAEYRVGVDDVLDINILKPEKLSITVNVSPDGS
ncbi:MAG: polysaccharide biosynthesis/export family protein, partial [Candidatus Omnitrophota bacterium]